METEKFELMLDEAQANAALEKGMLYADTFVNKNWNSIFVIDLLL